MLFKRSLDPQNKFLFYLLKKKNHNQAQIYIYTHKKIHNCWDDMLWYWCIAKVVYC